MRVKSVQAARLGLVVVAGLLLQSLALIAGPLPQARAEGFVSPAFEQQWKATDEAVSKGQVSRTYFWGPQAFAHTREVYNEGPDNGQREVQYFDKARMELTKKPGQDPNYVTNGLLTVELVSGQLQVGDNKFLSRAPSAQPVAGDPTGNPNTPGYASFGQARLAFGVAGALVAPKRAGQTVKEAVDGKGAVTTLDQPVKEVKYSRYFEETGHNLADIFEGFFRAAPLGEDKWLAVMGLPISEPYWIKDKVLVGGQPKDVLVQLFQRRVLTYTPANPAGFQVEMGNIGQHYFVWRYGFDVRDVLPGNYRVVAPQGQSLVSSSIRKPESVRLGSAPGIITNLWTTRQSSALVAANNGFYVTSLTSARPFNSLPLPANVTNALVREVGQSADSLTVAALIDSRLPEGDGLAPRFSAIEVYYPGTLRDDNTALAGSFTAYENLPLSASQLKVSADGSYLAFLEGGPAYVEPLWLNIYNVKSNAKIRLKLADYGEIPRLQWIGRSNQLLVSLGNYGAYVNGKSITGPGKLLKVDAATGTITNLLEDDVLRSASLSPDGNYLALMFRKDNPNSSLITNRVVFRALADLKTDLAPAYDQGTAGRYSNEPSLEGWSADGTYLLVRSSAQGTAGVNYQDTGLVSAVTGAALQKYRTQGYYMSLTTFSLGGPFYVIRAINEYNGPDAPTKQSVVVENLDGSEKQTLLSFQNNDLGIQHIQTVQVAPEARYGK